MLQRKTVVGLFEDMGEADRAIAELHDAGIPKNDIKFADSRGLQAHLVGDQTSGTGMRNLLARLFGLDYRVENEQASPLYSDWVQKGGVLVAVNTDDDRIGQVSNILETHGDIASTGRVRRTGIFEKAAESVEHPVRSIESERLARRAESNADERKLEVIEEELHVGKRKVQRGSVRVVKHVTETPVEETINLRDETVTIERRPLDRIASDADLKELADSRIEMIETIEEPVVSKEAHVKEEITISRKFVDHQEKIRDKVRKTEVDIEGLEPGRLREVEFRKDFMERFGKSGRNYTDYAPAYEFGSTLAFDERYKNRDWSDIENDARRQWESKRPNTWRDFSDAIHHGWKTIRGRRAA